MNVTSARRHTALVAAMLTATSAANALPLYVDLTPHQSSVRDQGARDTCGTFASIAAM